MSGLDRLGPRSRLLAGAVLSSATSLAAIGLLLTSAWLIVRAAQQPPVLYLMIAIVGVRFFGFARAGLRYAERLVTHDVALGRAVEARVAVYQGLDRLAPRGLAGRRHGDLVQQAVSDVDAVQDRLLRIRLPWWSAIVSAVVVSAVVAVIDRQAGLAVVGYAALSMVSIRAVVGRVAGSQRTSWKNDALAGSVTELVRAAPDLLAHGAAAGHAGAAHEEIARAARNDRGRAQAGGIGSALVLVCCAVAMWLQGTLLDSAVLDPVLVGVVLLAPLALVDAFDALAEAERLRPGVAAAHERIARIIDAPAPAWDTRAGPSPDGADLELDAVTLGWDSDLFTVHRTIVAGSAWAVTGPSGSGKSTLALTLAKLIEPRAGSIRLGGVDLRNLSGEQVRSWIGVMGQDDPVFDTTIRENLRIGRPDAADGALRTVLHRAGLRLDLDTPVGERGSRLSGGERQRLALARMLLADHRVLVLDEPTEHLDAPTARSLLDDVLALVPERTVIVISHAPDVVARFTNVLAVDQLPPCPRFAASPTIAGA